MLRQVSICTQNTKGTLQGITQMLADKDINIWGSCTNDGAEFGIHRMIVSDPEGAMDLLKDTGHICRMTSVIGVEVEDEVSNLNRLLKALTESNINIDYTYLSFNRDSGKPVLIFHCEDAPEVEICIKNKGFSVV